MKSNQAKRIRAKEETRVKDSKTIYVLILKWMLTRTQKKKVIDSH